MINKKLLANGRKCTLQSLIWEGVWDLLKVHRMGGKLLYGMKAFYRDANGCVK